MRPITILTADYNDASQADAVLTLVDAYARDPMGLGAPLPVAVKQQLISALLRQAGAFSLLAMDAGQPVGLVNCFEGFSTFAARPLMNVHDVFVLSAARGHGVAAALLEAVERVARARGCCAVTLEVLEGNHPARRVYERAGFNVAAGDPAQGRYMFWKKRLAD